MLHILQNNKKLLPPPPTFRRVYRYTHLYANGWTNTVFWDNAANRQVDLTTNHRGSKRNVFTVSHYRGGVISGLNESNYNGETIAVPDDWTNGRTVVEAGRW